jgi:hypothetical protein
VEDLDVTEVHSCPIPNGHMDGSNGSRQGAADLTHVPTDYRLGNYPRTRLRIA